MSSIMEVEKLLLDSFKVLNGLPDYISIEEKQNLKYDNAGLESKINKLIQLGEELKVKRISTLIDRSTHHYVELTRLLNRLGFERYASRVEVFRDLSNINGKIKGYTWKTLNDPVYSEDDFKGIWQQCMSGSDNASSSLTIQDYFNSVRTELGNGWRDSCRIIYKMDIPIGISIPHIEPGTIDEGRLFYFGLVPDERGKGESSPVHYLSLYFLKQMGASYYVGSTHESNKKMQRVFLKNGCSIKTQTESYYKYF